jgi:hypothetical protein
MSAADSASAGTAMVDDGVGPSTNPGDAFQRHADSVTAFQQASRAINQGGAPSIEAALSKIAEEAHAALTVAPNTLLVSLDAPKLTSGIVTSMHSAGTAGAAAASAFGGTGAVQPLTPSSVRSAAQARLAEMEAKVGEFTPESRTRFTTEEPHAATIARAILHGSLGGPAAARAVRKEGYNLANTALPANRMVNPKPKR